MSNTYISTFTRMNTEQHLHLTNFIMPQDGWRFVHLPRLTHSIMDRVHNINPNALRIFFDMNPSILSIELARMHVNGDCCASLENVQKLVLFQPVNAVVINFRRLVGLQRLRQLSITTYDTMSDDQWEGLLELVQLSHLKIMEQNTVAKTSVRRNQTLNRLFELLGTLDRLNQLTFDGDYNINSSDHRLFDRFIETRSNAKFDLNMDKKISITRRGLLTEPQLHSNPLPTNQVIIRNEIDINRLNDSISKIKIHFRDEVSDAAKLRILDAVMHTCSDSIEEISIQNINCGIFDDEQIPERGKTTHQKHSWL